MMQACSQTVRKVGRLLVLGTLAVAVPLSSGGPADFPPPRDFVEDQASVLDAGVRARLNGYLAELQRKTGVQMIVLTIDSTNGMEIRQFGHELAEHWKLGQKGKDNGVLVVVAVQDKRGTIEVGYGLESVLPDAFVGAVGRQTIRPAFTDGNYSKHVYDGVLMLANRVASAAGVKISGMPQRTVQRARSRGRGVVPCFGSLMPLIVIMIVFSALSRRQRGYRRWGYGSSHSLLWMMLFGSMLGGRRYGGWGGGFGGGGFGGGGFGGGSFGGGGGGSFGGGGASF
ncbi:MAG: TPM domain-containing protein [Phycisphaerae bacterium]